ncbi:hypothetical protein EPD60_06185 [Flaviaesturariibacter flavus]|uniref:Uncharacterized protein n=1 Tax=Flaviaesturariibacter flavus TaxID=2502780 RepID=A0A4R1BKA6_9BACT|nr:DUF5916 domain-containing protein [Flaviaesturariibacter flavus]TCJ17773.1 hypothetical protein EPD60_06185 [Flaviaesturariibacter flavus]
MWRRLLLFLNLLLFSIVLNAQQKTLTALRVTVAPRIDGNLDEAAWQDAAAATGFVQNYPAAGKPSVHPAKVYVLYDDAALYIGAYLYDDPALIRRQLTQRDGESRQDVDFFSIFLDTYNDKQNGFQFGVTSANVQTDARLGGASSSFDYGDKTWDAVWQSATSIKTDGWVAELRIPYISLRFTPREVQTWGLQLLRSTRRDNENAFWNPVDPAVNGFVNQFGLLEGLAGIRAPLRLSFSPYLSGGVRFNPEGSRQRTELLRSGGMDVKWGINRSFTLDATLIPDFGQVVSDNLVNNLTPYEIRFQENRPFFTEGTELFNKAGIFYSRRVGARPSYYDSVETLGERGQYAVEKNPSLTRLYNAIKLSGRTDKKLGIGVFNAVTAPMEARLRNLQSGKDSAVETEPMANYNLFVLDQAFNGRSFITLTNASVIRNGSARDANTTAFDWGLYDKSNKYALSGTLRGSNVFGYTPYSSLYFYNTDTVTRDGRRFLRPYSGYAARLRLAKVSGQVRYSGQVNIESDKYDPNDLGYLQAPNEITYTAGISYNQYQATRTFINYSYGLTLYHTSLYKPHRFSSFEAVASGYVIFKNFWDISLTLGAVPQVQYDFFELRKWGSQLQRPAFYYGNVSGSSDSRKKLYVSFGFGYEHSTLAASPYYSTNLGARYRFSNRFMLSLDLARQHDELQIGYAGSSNGRSYIGYRDFKDLASVLSGIYNFTPRMNLTLRARHYWSRVEYEEFFQIDEKGGHEPMAFIPGRDYNYNVFNLDAFYTWDFRPGSRIILGWKNAIHGTTAIDAIMNQSYGRNLVRTFDLAHANELSLRIIYFLDYNQLRRRR